MKGRSMLRPFSFTPTLLSSTPYSIARSDRVGLDHPAWPHRHRGTQPRSTGCPQRRLAPAVWGREAHPRRDDGESLAANRLVRAPHRIVVVPEDDLRAETLIREAGIYTDERARAVLAVRDSELSERRSCRDLRVREAVTGTLDAATKVNLVAGRLPGGVHELHPDERVAADTTEHGLLRDRHRLPRGLQRDVDLLVDGVVVRALQVIAEGHLHAEPAERGQAIECDVRTGVVAAVRYREGGLHTDR